MSTYRNQRIKETLQIPHDIAIYKSQRLLNDLLLTSPDDGEPLLVVPPPIDNKDGSYSIEVISPDGKRKWKHTIKTEEVADPNHDAKTP